MGEEHTDTALTFYDLGRVLQAQGELSHARHLYTRALEILNARVHANHYLIRLIQARLETLETA